MTRTCTACRRELPRSEFYRKLDGVTSRCKDCLRASARESRKAQPERFREYDKKRDGEKRRASNRAYHERNRASRNAQSKAWYEANRERSHDYQATYYAENRDRITARSEAWRAANPSRIREVRRLASARRRARLRSLPAEAFTVDDVWSRDAVEGSTTCYLCGLSLTVEEAHIEHLIPVAADPDSLERLGLTNPGTVLANVTLAHSGCNRAKGRAIDPRAVALYRRQASLVT